MALKLNDGTVLRNLEEQVQYLTDYHQANEGIAQWGIHIVGQVATAAELPNEETYSGEFGDTYAVGTEAPYDFYIWTRTSASGQHGYWFPFGPISIVGPQGIPGKKGDKGDTGESTQWYTVLQNLPNANTFTLGDMLLRASDGMVYRCGKSADNTYKEWKPIVNIMGSPGIQGKTGPAPIISSNNSYITSTDPQTGFTTNVVSLESLKGDTGATGDPGGFIKIRGILTNSAQLPYPTELRDLEAAYLVGAVEPYELYIQVGETYETADWVPMGALNAATYVSVNGNFQNTWNADTKLDKATGVTLYSQVYVKTSAGNQEMWSVISDIANNAVVRRTGNGDVLVPDTPVSPYGAVNKNYIGNNCLTKNTTVTSHNQVYGKHQNGTEKMFDVSYSNDALAQMIPMRDVGGAVYIPDSAIGRTDYNFAAGQEAVNKNYVDNLFGSAHGKIYYTVYAASVDWAADDEQSWNKPIFTFASSEDVVGGAITTPTLASMLYTAGYNNSDAGAFVSNAQSNNYAISSPLITIWSPNGTSLYGYAPTRPDDIPLSAASWNIHKCKH